MATDAALLAATRPDRAVWRWYAWQRPTISFGRHEATRGRFHDVSLADAGLAAVRRPTGGRALLHAREITYSVTCALDADAGWREAYDAVNAILLAVLQEVGVTAERASAAATLRPDGPTCFEAPAAGEIVCGGRKLVGSAVWRQERSFLQHGSILLHDDQPRLATACRLPLPAAPPAAALALLAPGVGVGTLDDALRRILAAAGADVTGTASAPSSDVEALLRMERERFADPAWLWRR